MGTQYLEWLDFQYLQHGYVMSIALIHNILGQCLPQVLSFLLGILFVQVSMIKEEWQKSQWSLNYKVSLLYILGVGKDSS